MKDQQFFITEESLSRAKKQLKKALKNEGLEVSLAKSANLIAKSFGFNDEHEMQIFIKKQVNSNGDIDSSSYQNISGKKEIDDLLKNMKGNIIVFGRIGSGKYTYAQSLMKQLMLTADAEDVKLIDLCDYNEIPENKAPYFIPQQKVSTKYFYVAKASNLFELKKKIREVNPNYNFNDIQCFIDVNTDTDNAGPKIFVNESFNPNFKPKTQYGIV